MKSYADIAKAYDEGRFWQSEIRKVTSLLAGSYRSADLSYTGGLPLPNYYATTPLEMATLNGNKGLYKGSPNTGQKYIHKMCIANLSSLTAFTNVTLYDYVAYVPFVDLDMTDEQEVVTIDLPRFTDGKGLRVLAVSQGAGSANTNLTMTYINQDGVEKVATTTLDASQVAGNIITSGQSGVGGSSYMKFAQGDYGIRKITKVQCSLGVGAICALVIVKPLCSLNFSEVNTPTEIDYLADKGGLIPIHNDAYLNLCMFNTRNNTASPSLIGYLQTIWEAS
jgi:hypothetical protein